MRLVATLWTAGVAALLALVLVAGVSCSPGNGNKEDVLDAKDELGGGDADVHLDVVPDVEPPDVDTKDQGKDEEQPDVTDVGQDQDNATPPDEVEPDEVEPPLCLYPCQNSDECKGKLEGENDCNKALCLPDEACAGVNPDSPKQCKLVKEAGKCCSDEECMDDNECTINEKCVEHACTSEFDPNNPDCCVNNVLLKLDFENIQVGEMPPQEKAYCTDKQPGDNVLCSVQPVPCGGKAVYFGDPACKTYNSGQMIDCKAVELMECTEETQDEDCPLPKADCDKGFCVPSPKAARVTFELVAPEINLPGTALLQLSFRFFIDAEFEPGAELNFDTLDVIARVAGGGGTEEELVYSSVKVENSTKGKCILVAADLTKYAGKSIDLIWRFDTYEGTSNLGQGVYIDDITVSTFCLTDQCLALAECDDDNVCTADECGQFVNKLEGGVCIHDQADPDCKECATVDDCQVKGGDPIDPCTLADCVKVTDKKSKCVWSPNPECCTQDDLGQYGKQGFESGKLPSDWSVETQPGNPISWATVSANAAPDGGDEYALAFGAGSYDCGQNHCWGKVTTGKFDLSQVSTKAFVKLTFLLRMGTEWDKVASSEYLSAGIDTLTIFAILENGNEVQVWSSDVIFGTTGYDQNPGSKIPDIEPVWADLTQFAGQKIQLRFEFDTGDVTPPENNYFGVLIDELSIETVCEEICLAAADCITGGDCMKGKCVDGVCAYDPIPECCTQVFNPKCDDQDPCTDDQCDQGAKTCTHQFNGAPNCCTPKEQVFYHNFDAGTPGEWKLIESGANCGDGKCEEPETCITCPSDCAECTVRWQVVDKQAFTPEFSLFFGNTANWTYDNGQNPAYGKITSPAFKLPPYGVPVVSFMLWLETEHSALFVEPADFDKLTLFVEWADKVDSPTWSKASEAWNSLSWDVKGNTDGWKKIEVGLKKLPLQGKAVRFTFEFNSFDAFNNGFGGAYVDEFKVKTICNDTYVCTSAFECAEATPDNPHCSIEQCTAGTCLPTVNPLKDGCCVQEVLPIKDGTANFDFEPAGMDGWKATPPNAAVMWQYSDAHPCGGKGALWFGNKNTGDYSDPGGKAVKGTACSPDVDVTGMGSVEVSFCVWADLKDPFHWLDSLSLKMDSALFAGGDPIGVKKELWHKPCSGDDFECADPKKPQAPCNVWGCDGLPMQSCTCFKLIVDLSAYNWVPGVDHRAVFCFEFDSGDGAANKGAGVFVDDVQVKTLCQ